MHRDLAGFKFEVSRVDKTLIRKFSDLSFTDDARKFRAVSVEPPSPATLDRRVNSGASLPAA
jgi:hypothetical protein